MLQSQQSTVPQSQQSVPDTTELSDEDALDASDFKDPQELRLQADVIDLLTGRDTSPDQQGLKSKMYSELLQKVKDLEDEVNQHKANSSQLEALRLNLKKARDDVSFFEAKL